MNYVNNANNFPQIQDAFKGWGSSLTLVKTVETVTDGDKVITEINYTGQGVIQPLNPKGIALKPEGQRAWQWFQIHWFSGFVDLNVDDRIKIDGSKYKIMAVNDYQRNGYLEYHLVKDYE